MNKSKQQFYVASLIFLASIFNLALAAGGDVATGRKIDPILAPVIELIEDEQYKKAVDAGKVALSESPDNADLLNLIAYSYRNLEQLEIALEHYLQALTIEPDHRGANEYLGELYLQTDRLELALERLAVLDDECFFPCKEYTDLKNAIETYQQAQ